MLKKLIAVMLMLTLLLVGGCSKKEEKQEEPTPPVEEQREEPQKPADSLNPLTGVYGEAGIATQRPVAIMINNDVRAQNAQAGLPEADIIYETEIEGGETRLMAVFQNLKSVQNIGTVRSARWPYIDLAVGHNAIYIHRGNDSSLKNYLTRLNRIDIHENLYGERIKNGLALEHTLYTHGPALWEGIGTRFETKQEIPATWQKFADEKNPVTPAEKVANKITVPFSGNFKTVFHYRPESGLYERGFKEKIPTEYFTKETTKVKNVVVCLSNIYTHSNGVHRLVTWGSGEAYYFTNGGQQTIRWTKENEDAPLKFTNVDGTPLTMNPGSTWVCFSSASYSKPIVE